MNARIKKKKKTKQFFTTIAKNVYKQGKNMEYTVSFTRHDLLYIKPDCLVVKTVISDLDAIQGIKYVRKYQTS